MKYHILAFGAGFLMDQIFGDPYFLPHPIRGIGWLIAKTEKVLRSGNPQENSPEREAAERRQGKLLVVIVLLLTGMFTALILVGAYALYPKIGMVVEAVMTYQILAGKRYPEPHERRGGEGCHRDCGGEYFRRCDRADAVYSTGRAGAWFSI